MTPEETEAEIASLKNDIKRLDLALEMLDERLGRAFESMDARVTFLRRNAELRP